MAAPRLALGFALLLLLSALPLALPAALPTAPLVDTPNPVPDVVAGFSLAPLTTIGPNVILSGMTFGPGGPDLYAAASTTNVVVRVPLIWTPAGLPVAGAPVTYASGFSQPIGVIFQGDTLYVSDSHVGSDTDRTVGRITRVAADGHQTVVVDGLPNGRHNTNHFRFGPDGRLYFGNGNPNDNGRDGGAADVFPYSGAILSIDTAQVGASPAKLFYKDAAGATIPADRLASASVNADFATKVHVLAHGFRNVYGIAFDRAGHAFTAMNGPDAPSAQDAFYTIQPGADYGYPFCYPAGAPYAVGDAVSVATNPTFPGHDCTGVPHATALLGWHTCATGLDVPQATGLWSFPAAYRSSVFVAECTQFFVEQDKLLDGGVWPNLSHKVVRLPTDARGIPTEVSDFATGFALPTDALFGPDGALYVGDAAVVYRIAPLVPNLV